MENLIIRKLKQEDIPKMVKNFQNTYLNGREKILQKYLEEQNRDERIILIATFENIGIIGYATLLFKSHYPNFLKNNIPEILDINVIPLARNKGAATAMLTALETMAKTLGYRKIGLGVGLYAEYGPAQRLYIKNGYIPDGKGLFYSNKFITPGEKVTVDDDLVLYLVKQN